jgi:leader peptidase (prepilin peptidase)/N-methyltransferase
MFFYIVVLLILIVASVEDLLRKEVSVLIPVLFGINSFSSVIASIFSGEFNCTDIFVSLLPGVLLLLVGVVTGQAVGYGDDIITLCFAPALGLFNTCLCFAVAMTASAFVSIIILVLRKGDKNTRLPFVPFITLGVGVTILAQI